MAIPLNSVSQAATAGSTSFSVSHTVNAGTNRLMLVFVECPNSTDYMATGTVSYGGTSLGAAVLLPPTTPALSMYTYVFRMVAPPVGTANIVVTPSASAFLNVKVITLNDMDQTTPIAASNAARLGFAPGSTYSLPISAPPGGLAVGVFVCRNTTSTIAAIDGATEIGTITSNTASRMIASIKENAASLGYSFTGSQPTVGVSAVALNAAAGSDPAPIGVVTLGTPTDITSNSATIPYFYSENDETGFEYRLNGGSEFPVTSSPLLLTGLTAGTFYSTEMRAMNGSTPGDWSAPETFTTAAGGDVTPPTFTVAPAVSSITQTGGTATAEINETGSIFYVVVPQAQATPSVAQVIAGQNASGTAPIDSGSAVGTTTLSDAFTGTTAGQLYKSCFAARDDEPTPNVQASVTVVNFTAAAAPVGTITLIDFAANTAVLTGPLSNITCMVLADDASGVVVIKPGLAINSGSDLTFTDALLIPGTWYTVVPFGGTNRGVVRVQAT